MRRIAITLFLSVLMTWAVSAPTEVVVLVPTNVIVRVVVTNTPPPIPPTNAPPTCEKSYNLEVSGGVSDPLVYVYRVEPRKPRRLLRAYRPKVERKPPSDFGFAPILADRKEVDISPGGLFRENHPDGN